MTHLAVGVLVVVAIPCAVQAACPEESPPFARGCRAIELSTLYQVEAWDENESWDKVVGGAAAISWAFRDGWALVGEGVVYRVAQPATPSHLGGALGLLRRRLYERRRLSIFADAGLGASYADEPVPTRGTRFNYLLQAGAGLSARLTRQVDFIGHVRHLHLSNNGLAGSSRNPDIQSLGVQVGVMVRLQ